MTERAERVMTFRPDRDIADAMEVLKERDGIPLSEQLRRAMRDWLRAKGVMKDAEKRPMKPRR